MSSTLFASMRIPAKVKIATTKWCCCCTNRTAALILVSFILLGDITVGIESWLVTFGVWAPAVKSIIVHTTGSNSSSSSSSPINGTGGSPTTTLVVRSLRSWYALDAIYCTFDIVVTSIALYGLVHFRAKWLKPLRILEFVWLIVMTLLFLVGLTALVSNSTVLADFFVNALSWMFSANTEPMFEEQRDAGRYSLPIGSVVFAILIQAWILVILAAAAHELRMTTEQRRTVAGDEASGIEYGRMSSDSGAANGPAIRMDSTTTSSHTTTVPNGNSNGSTAHHGTTRTINGVGNFWDIEANHENRQHGISSSSNEFDVMDSGGTGAHPHASSVVVEFDEPFESHHHGGAAGGVANGPLKV